MSGGSDGGGERERWRFVLSNSGMDETAGHDERGARQGTPRASGQSGGTKLVMLFGNAH